MNKEFEKNVDFLRRNIPPDDIYMFAEQVFAASLYFLKKWNEGKNMREEFEDDEACKLWVQNIVTIHLSRQLGQDVSLDLLLREGDEEE